MREGVLRPVDRPERVLVGAFVESRRSQNAGLGGLRFDVRPLAQIARGVGGLDIDVAV